jgi:hypothetical protein
MVEWADQQQTRWCFIIWDDDGMYEYAVQRLLAILSRNIDGTIGSISGRQIHNSKRRLVEKHEL